MGYIYILIEREFIKTKERIYKLGRTKDWRKRLQQYPNGSVMLLVVETENEVLTEKCLLRIFNTVRDILLWDTSTST